MATSLRVWLGELKVLLESAGLKMSPAPFAASATPRTLEDMSFVIDVQTVNTKEYRDDDYLVRARHTVLVTVVKKVKPLDQFTSLLEAADIEAAVHDKMLPRSSLPDTVVTWSGTRRILTPAREHMLIELSYGCVVDFTTGHTPQE